MADSVYPDFTTSRFDMNYVKRLVISSDIRRPTTSTTNVVPAATGELMEGGELEEQTNARFPILSPVVPDDQEHTVSVSTDVIEGDPTAILEGFKNWAIDVFRDNVPIEDFTWNPFTAELALDIAPIFGEIFTFHAKGLYIPGATEYETKIAGTVNINNFVEDNPVVFLPIYKNVRLRIWRNNILQSFNTEFTWDRIAGELTWLLVPPVMTETFIVKPY